jgi:aspartate/methionine/tyrosine aminotransferase
MERIVGIAERCGAWLLVDEVYRGAEHRDEVRLSNCLQLRFCSYEQLRSPRC